MSPLKFERLLAGQVLDLFNKEFAHGNFWQVEHKDKTKFAEFVNDYKLNREQHLVGTTTVKGLLGKNSELKFQSSGNQLVELCAPSFGYDPLSLYLKLGFDTEKKRQQLELSAEHVLPLNTTALRLVPLEKQLNLFTLFNFGPQQQCLVGAEFSGSLDGPKPHVTLAAAYHKQLDQRKYLFSVALDGNCDFKESNCKLVANALASCVNAHLPNTLAASVEQEFAKTKPKFKVAGQFHLTPLDHPTAAYLKAKCDSEANVALAYVQRFSPNFSATLGCQFQGKGLFDGQGVQYGVKFNLE